MSNQTPIIAFSKDWHEDHTSNHHVLRELARTRRVLWLNSVGTRTPSMSSSRDLGKIKRKLTEFASGAINVENDLWVATPLVLPLPHSPLATKLNQQIIRATIRALRYQLGIEDFQLWTFLPNTVDYVGALGEKLAVYYCVDEWSTFTALDAQATIAAEKRLLAKVDVTFCTSQALVDSKSRYSKVTQFAPHGVNFESFARAMRDDLEIPADLARIPQPRLGFFGTLRDLIDYQLIAGMARARPDVHIALIGQKHVDLSELEALPNVHFLGQKRHDELAAYCKGFDVGWIPYRIDDNVKFINPLKLREYLSAGVPVISTSMPEVLPFKHLAHIADTPEQTSSAFDKAIGEGSLDARRARCESMRNETWPARVSRISKTVDDLCTGSTVMSNSFRAGMIGSGNICEFHVAAVKKLAPNVELVGICDLDPTRAQANAEKWGTTAYKDLDALVAAGANVIHVLTPPSSHGKIAIAALERGCHVLIEKPIAEDPDEARRIGELARQKGLTVTCNHSLLYDPQIKRALDMVAAGKLGDIVSVDILRGSEYPPYEGGQLPPWYRDAGYPFRDIGVHCLYLIQELLGTIEDVSADYRSLGGDPNLAFDEWRALVRCKRGLAQFQLTYNVKPMQSQIIIHGTKGVLRVDLFAMFHGKRSSTPLPKAAERLLNAFTDSLQPLIDVPIGVYKFVRKQVQAYQGLRDLVAEFYRRLGSGEAPPVSVEDAATVVEWVEKVARAADADHNANLARFKLADRVPYLVTGASGSLGKAVVKRLRAEGHKVRVFQRRIPAKPQDGLEYAFGNLGDPVAVDRAVKGAEIVIHCGAAMKGGWPEHKGGTVAGTQNVIDACKQHGVKQLVHISSMSVFDWAGSSGAAPVDESVNLEPRADERGAYTRAKLEAEQLVTQAATTGLPAVILRPGQIFGGGIDLINGAVARNAGGRWLVLGDGKLELPLVYIDDVVDSVMLSIARKLTNGEVIQIVDPEALTQEDVLGLAGGAKAILRVPRAIVFALGRLSEIPLGAIGKPSPIGVYRLKSALARIRYESKRALEVLGWHPRVGVREGIRRVSTEAAEPVPQASSGTPPVRAVAI